ncbi:MAG: hypothetical protein JWM86_1973 [Thermoleophilia bacterium]|nr:hypothetical protein [Thermoleophilia bacterium]
MTAIAPMGNPITMGDARAGLGAGATTLVGSTVLGIAAGMTIGNRLSPGGPGKGLGLMLGGLAGGITGLGSGAAVAGAVTLLRDEGHDLTTPAAISGGVGGAIAGAVHGVRGGNSAVGVLTLGALGALFGVAGGALAGTLFD